MRFAVSAIALAWPAAFLCAQAVSFDAASVKPSGPDREYRIAGGPGTRDPQRFTTSASELRILVCRAYGIIRTQCEDRVAGPSWIGTDKFDVAASIPAGTTAAQFRQMLQNLLAERFKLAVHHESRIVPVYELVVAKSGSKLKEPAANTGRAAPPLAMSCSSLQCRTVGNQETIAGMIEWLRGPAGEAGGLDRPILDRTGLAGRYDFTLEFEWHKSDAPAGAPALGLDIREALQEQLGLKLVEAKTALDVVVVDHADRTPAQN